MNHQPPAERSVRENYNRMKSFATNRIGSSAKEMVGSENGGGIRGWDTKFAISQMPQI